MLGNWWLKSSLSSSVRSPCGMQHQLSRRNSNTCSVSAEEPDEREQGKTEPENLSDEERAPREAAGDNASSLDREEAERLLDALQDREKQAQLRRTKTEPGARGKDW